jgi:hypothetical protein
MTTTSEEFLADVKRLITVPANQYRLDNAGFLAFGNRKTQDTLVPVIDSLQQEYFVTTSTVPILTGINEYAIPSRALGRKMRDVKLVSPSGGRSDFPKIAVEREQFYRVGGSPFGFYFYGDRIRVVPVPAADGYSLQLWWFLGPSKLVLSSAAAVVTAINTDVVTVAAVPSNIVAGSIVDFVQGVGGNSTIGYDKTVVSIVGNDISFATGDVPTLPALAAGDYISLAQTSPVLQIPDSAVPYLVTLTAMEVLQSIGDYEGHAALKETRDTQEKNLKMLLEPRVEGEATPIINDYGFIGGPRRGLWGLLGE